MMRGVTGKDAMKLLQTTAFSFNTEPTRVDQDLLEPTATELGIQLIKRPPGSLFEGIKPPKKQSSLLQRRNLIAQVSIYHRF